MYRILSLDGGGTWSLIQVRTLIDLFGGSALGQDVLRCFDLAVANSGGSLVLGALALNQSLSDILTVFELEAKRDTVFRGTWTERIVATVGDEEWPYPRYSTTHKYEGLLQIFGPNSLVALRNWRGTGTSLPDLLFVGFDYDMERSAFFRTNTASLASSWSSLSPGDETLLDAVHASSNPPVLYFDGPTRVPHPDGPLRYWDGAIGGYNNPAMAGVVEALANNVERDQIRVLALGTGTVHRPRRPVDVSQTDARFMGGHAVSVIGDIKKISTAIMDDPPDVASFVAHVTLGGKLPQGNEVIWDGPLVRMSPVVRPLLGQDGQWRWPGHHGDYSDLFGPQEWARLTTLGLDTLAQGDIVLIGRFCSAWLNNIAANQPIRAGDALTAEIGHDTYSEAKEAMQKWLPLQTTVSTDA